MTSGTFRLRQNLTELLKMRKMSAARLSKETGVAKQVLSDWMSGVKPRKIEHLYAVAKVFGVTLETLCFSDSLISAKSDSLIASIGQSWPDNEVRGKFEIHIKRIED